VGLGLGERVVKALLEGDSLPTPTAQPAPATALA
jgi:hypothetical protein